MNPIRFTAFAAIPLALMTLPLAPSVPLAGSAAFAQAMSPAVGEPLKRAQAAAKAGNTQGALNEISKARAAAKTASDRQKVHQMAGYVYTVGRQYGKAAAELEAGGATPRQLAPLYYQAGQYNKAIDAARKSGNTTIVAQSYLKMGNTAEAAKVYNQILSKNPNNSAALQNLAGIQYRSGNHKAYLSTITRLIRIDPTPNRWRAVLLDMRNDGPRQAQLSVYHLMQATNALKPTEYQDYAKLAILEGQAGTVTDLLSGSSDPMVKNMARAAVNRQAASLKAAPVNAKRPDKAMDAGGAYLGAKNYNAAAQAFAVAAKGPGGAAALLNRGIAQTAGGQYSAAKSTFAAIPEGDYKDVANMWSLYATTKGG